MTVRQKIGVHTTVDGKSVPAGVVFASKGSLTFRYDSEYLENRAAYDIAPALPRMAGSMFHFNGLGPFSDSAPDRWGRRLLNRALKRTRVSEIEYLLGVDDLTRQGALRYVIDGVAQADGSNVPVLTDLPVLLDTADAVSEDRDVSDVALRRLYKATGSLGGARPKACVYDHGCLWMAKFPKPNGDDWDVIGWEGVTLDLARLSGIDVPCFRVLDVQNSGGAHRSVLLTQRFDRFPSSEGPQSMARIPYMSAMTALDLHDGDGGDWLDLAEYARSVGCDLEELWHRAVFGAVIGNCDDHLRNHGFLRDGNGWTLSPAFDINPEPYDPNMEDAHQMALFGDTDVTVDALMRTETLELFAVPRERAIRWCRKLRSILNGIGTLGGARRLDTRSLGIMRSRFEEAINELDAVTK